MSQSQNLITLSLELEQLDDDLSPAANAILDAYMDNCGWLDGPMQRDYQCAAAVLRAAADQIENLYCDGDVEDSPGIVFTLRQLMLIAAELEAQ
jgi:hypothetical protein